MLERGQLQEVGDGRRWLDGAIFDITTRRAAEQALREHEIVEAQLAEVRASRARIVEAADRAAVERFNRADPFHAAGIWERITITGFIRRQG